MNHNIPCSRYYSRFRIRLLLIIAVFLATAFFTSSCRKEITTLIFTELPSGTTHDLNDIFFVNDSTGYACGGERYTEGNILKTTDGGNTWKAQGENLNKALNRQYYASADSGFIVGMDGKIYKTTDAGNYWNLYQSPRYQPLHDVVMLTAQKALCCGGDGYKTGYIYSTYDGGEHWSIDTFPMEFRSLFFTDDETGFVAGYGVIFKTTDGGTEWQLTEAKGDFFQSVFFTSALTGYAVGYEGTILKTENGGDDWELLRNGNNILQETWHPGQITFRDATTGYIIGEKGCFLRTSDAGVTWQQVENAPKIDFHGIYLTSSGGFLCGEGGKIFRFLE